MKAYSYSDIAALTMHAINVADNTYIYDIDKAKGAYSTVTPATLRASAVRFDVFKGVAAVRPFNPAFARIDNDVFKRAVLQAYYGFAAADIAAVRARLPKEDAETFKESDADCSYAAFIANYRTLVSRLDAAESLIRKSFVGVTKAYNRTVSACAELLYGNVSAPAKNGDFDALMLALKATRESAGDDVENVPVHDLRTLRRAYDAVNLALWTPSAAHGVNDYIAHVSADMTLKLYRLYVRRVGVDKVSGGVTTSFSTSKQVYADVIALLFEKVQDMHAAAAAAAAAESAADIANTIAN